MRPAAIDDRQRPALKPVRMLTSACSCRWRVARAVKLAEDEFCCLGLGAGAPRVRRTPGDALEMTAAGGDGAVVRRLAQCTTARRQAVRLSLLHPRISSTLDPAARRPHYCRFRTRWVTSGRTLDQASAKSAALAVARYSSTPEATAAGPWLVCRDTGRDPWAGPAVPKLVPRLSLR
jgi:hypothetical protein